MLRRMLTSLTTPSRADNADVGLGPGATAYERWDGPLHFDALPRQGALGDCWIMAPMLAIHCMDPQFFESSIRFEEGSGRASARIFRDGSAEWVSVPMAFPAGELGQFVYARESGFGPGWPAILEKAVAGEIAGSYRWIARGLATLGFPLLTGVPARMSVPVPGLDKFERWLDEGRPSVVSSHPFSPALSARESFADATPIPRVPANHVMAVVGVNGEAGTLLVRNPWAPEGVLEFPEGSLHKVFLSADVSARPLRTH